MSLRKLRPTVPGMTTFLLAMIQDIYHAPDTMNQVGSTYSRIRMQRQLLVACAAGIVTVTAGRDRTARVSIPWEAKDT